MVSCPVCKINMSDDGTLVLPMTEKIKIETNKLVHKGKTYFFDSTDCAREFAANPDKYAEK